MEHQFPRPALVVRFFAIDFVGLDLPEPEIGQTRIRATVLSVDRFGNAALNLTRDHLDSVSVVPGSRVELTANGDRYYAVAARTFADARPGDLILYEDSYGNLAIAINGGDAARMFQARAGDEVRVGPAPE